MTGDPRTAEELVQEAFLRGLLHEDVLAGLSESQQRAWLYRTVKNLHIDYVRRKKWELSVDSFPETQAAELSEEMFMVEWGELLMRLPKLERRIFVLRYLHGYTSGQIGICCICRRAQCVQSFMKPENTFVRDLAMGSKIFNLKCGKDV